MIITINGFSALTIMTCRDPSERSDLFTRSRLTSSGDNSFYKMLWLEYRQEVTYSPIAPPFTEINHAIIKKLSRDKSKSNKDVGLKSVELTCKISNVASCLRLIVAT